MAADSSGDMMLLKVAVFGLTMSLMCTVLVAVLLPEDSSDYNYDEIEGYRNDLVAFSGDSMINQTPWVLQHVYTPWDPSQGAKDHIEDGWLYGSEITDYEYIGQSANIKLDTEQKSATPLSYTDDAASYTEEERKWYAKDGQWYSSIVKPFKTVYSGLTGNTGVKKTTYTGDNWNYTGYRYVFDPVLPFSNEGSSKDGSLSLVWYAYNGYEGLSGGLDVYGGNVLIAHMTATDIISAYNTSRGYATTYEWDFGGTYLTLSIYFDPTVIEAGTPLMAAFTNGDWSMAISSTSAGNFFDLKNSGSFATTAGSVVKTFKKIFTFDLDIPGNNEWAKAILWLLCGLPMTIAMLCVTFRIINTVKFIG